MFSEISLHILDIVENSIKAGGDFIEIKIQVHTDTKRLIVETKDNGCGMNKEQLAACENPFFTSRTTRKVGLGIPFLRQSAECTGGSFSIHSEVGEGTSLRAEYFTDHIDCIPMGDINATIFSLVIMNGSLDFYYLYQVDERQFVLDTRQIRQMVGDIPFDTPEISAFIKDFLQENKQEVDNGKLF